jgi:hypothetical protein
MMARATSATASVVSRAVPFFLRLLGLQCGHYDYTIPMHLPGERGVTVSCLQCAARLGYDWDRMGLQ